MSFEPETIQSQQTIAIIGAGAAGCFAAANIPFSPGRQVLIFEKTGKALQKVKVSGGGRCNITHNLFEIPALIDKYPRGKQLLKKAFYSFGPQETVEWFRSRGLKLKAEADGRMFPVTDQSQSVIDCLNNELGKKNVKIHFHKSIEKIERKQNGFELFFSDKTVAAADKVLVACGGFPKKEQYAWIEKLGHRVSLPVPSLFTFNLPDHPITSLMGVSVPAASVKIAGTKISVQGPVLITHWGLSGPAVLKASAWGARILNEKNYRFSAQINWLGNYDSAMLKNTLEELRKHQGKQPIATKNPFSLPKRLWDFLLEEAGIQEGTNWGTLQARSQRKLSEWLIAHPFEVSGKTTFKEEFVTCGGIELSEINPQTMESRLIPNLYFAGEILNVDGITGGFNFQHAWTSAYIASQNMGID